MGGVHTCNSGQPHLWHHSSWLQSWRKAVCHAARSSVFHHEWMLMALPVHQPSQLPIWWQYYLELIWLPGSHKCFWYVSLFAWFEGWQMNSTSIQGLDASEGAQCPHYVTHRAFCGESLLHFTLSQQKRHSAWQVYSLMLKTIFTILKHAIPSHLWSLYQGCWFWIWTRKREGCLRSSGCRKNKPLSLTLDLMGSQIHHPQYLW